MVKEPYRSTDPMAGYSTGMRAPAPYPPRSTPPTQSARPSGGSIMQGTSLVATPTPRTEGLLRPVAQGRDVGGSITQGTPILVKETGHPSYEGASPMGYYKNSLPVGQPTRMPYQTDPQLCSRQIILSDYLLSQQMVGQNSGRREQAPPSSRANERPPPPHVVYQYRPPSPMYVQKMAYMEPHHPYPPHSSGPTPPMHPQQQQQQQQQQPPQQPTPPQQQQRQGVIQRNSSVPASRPSEPRPSPPVSHSTNRTSSPAGLLPPHSGRYPISSTSVSISPRGDSIYTHDAFASLVNAAAAQPSLPVPERDRRDRERERDRDKERDLRQNPAGFMPR